MLIKQEKPEVNNTYYRKHANEKDIEPERKKARCIRYEGIVIWQNSRLSNKPFAVPQTVATARW